MAAFVLSPFLFHLKGGRYVLYYYWTFQCNHHFARFRRSHQLRIPQSARLCGVVSGRWKYALFHSILFQRRSTRTVFFDVICSSHYCQHHVELNALSNIYIPIFLFPHILYTITATKFFLLNIWITDIDINLYVDSITKWFFTVNVDSVAKTAII